MPRRDAPLLAAALTLLTVATAPSPAQPGPFSTALTYQGRLTDAGAPADGVHDMVFRLYNEQTGGAQVAMIGSAASPIPVGVEGGLFTVELDFPSPDTIFNGTERWLEIAVREPGGGFVTLTPRQRFAPAPFANRARATDDIPAEWKSFRVDDTTGHHSVSAGNVGIGTASPARRLDIRTAGGSGAEGVRLTHPALPSTWDLVVGGPADTFAQDLAVLGFGDVVLPNADLGVGTDPLPGKALHVEGDAVFDSNTRFGLIIGDPNITDGGGSAVRIGTRSDNGGPGVVQSIEDAGTDFGRLLLNPEGGRVGIGPFAYSDVFCTVRAHGGHPTLFAVYTPNNDQVFRVEDDGDIAGCGISCISDGRHKQAVEPLAPALNRVTRLRPVSFEWRAELERDPDRRFGLIAQEVERVFPELVDTMNDGTRTVDYTALSAVLLGAVQEQQAEIERLRAERDDALAEHEALLESFETRLRRLEADSSANRDH